MVKIQNVAWTLRGEIIVNYGEIIKKVSQTIGSNWRWLSLKLGKLSVVDFNPEYL